MSEMKFDIKGPVGAVLGVVILGAIIYFKYFMPFTPTVQDREAVLEKLKQLRVADMSMISKANVDHYKETGQIVDSSKAIKNLTGKIEITDIAGKKTFLSGIKIKVTYTIDGKTPKADGGVLYFQLHRRKQGKIGVKKIIDLYQITEDNYGK